jgi:flagellar motor switch protein FliM
VPEERSDDDLAQLLSQVGEGGPNGAAEAFARTPLAYDFRRPQRIHKDQLRAIENLHEQFARLCAGSLAGAMRMVIDVDVAFVDQVLYSEFVLSLSSPCCAYRFAVTPPGAVGVLSLATPLVMALIDRAFGGRGIAMTGDARPLTPIETGVVGKVVQRLLGDLEAVWEPLVGIEIGDLSLETNPEFMQVAAAGESVLLVAFEATAAHAGGLVHLAYPLTGFDALLSRLLPAARQRGGEAASRRRLRSSPVLDKVQIPLVAELARGSLSLRDLAQLGPGDVIRLDTSKEEPAVVFLGSQPKFLGRAGLDGKRRAVKVTRALETGEEEAYR